MNMPSVVLPFSCYRSGGAFHIGKINRTSWCVTPHADTMYVSRMGDLGKVLIDITVNFYSNGNLLRQSQITEQLNEGQATVTIPLEVFTCFITGGYQGSIKVYSPPKILKLSVTEECSCTCPTSQVSDDYLSLFENAESFTDAVLKCKEEEIPVHKCILSARSPVFAAMFKNEMQESKNGVVDIVDMEPEVLKAMLRHLYSGKSDHLTESISADLLFAADKYQLDSLKVACINTLKASMTPDNIFHILVLGDMHDKGLRQSASEYICNCDKFSELEKNEKWKLLREERPELAMDVLTSIVNYVQEKWRKPPTTAEARRPLSGPFDGNRPRPNRQIPNRLQIPHIPARLVPHRPMQPLNERQRRVMQPDNERQLPRPRLMQAPNPPAAVANQPAPAENDQYNPMQVDNERQNNGMPGNVVQIRMNEDFPLPRPNIPDVGEDFLDGMFEIRHPRELQYNLFM